MPTLSDSDVQDGEEDIITEYENQESDGGNENVNQSGDLDQENEEDKEEPTIARRIDPSTSKKHVRNPIPTLNTERLKGPKGIQTIEKYFEGFKFHGKGHEKTDLDKIMKRMEHWAHRLFPKLDFDDFLTRVEKLGTKKDLQVYIRKYRDDTLSADNDLVTTETIDDEGEKEEDEAIDEFDKLIDEQIKKQKRATIQQETSMQNTSMDDAQAKNDAFDKLLTDTVNRSSQPKKDSIAPSQLSDEVKERIERNRQQAIQRRLARLQQLNDGSKRNKLEGTDDTQVSKKDDSNRVDEQPESNKSNNGLNDSQTDSNEVGELYQDSNPSISNTF